MMKGVHFNEINLRYLTCVVFLLANAETDLRNLILNQNRKYRCIFNKEEIVNRKEGSLNSMSRTTFLPQFIASLTFVLFIQIKRHFFLLYYARMAHYFEIISPTERSVETQSQHISN